MNPRGKRIKGRWKQSREYQAWNNMKGRCLNPNHKQFSHYGGRGIHVCKRWVGSFDLFFSDMGGKPSSSHTLERRDNSKGYTKANCYWATRQEQARNRRSTILTLAKAHRIRKLYAEGVRVKKIAQQFGVAVSTVYFILRDEVWEGL